mmetsp:Transcript_12923/g.17850  ORF Transcript_12923/g.17850 Transcript_12923/m.17850 type:complete len:98 (-) Transcript_12923:16-309(-)
MNVLQKRRPLKEIEMFNNRKGSTPRHTIRRKGEGKRNARSRKYSKPWTRSEFRKKMKTRKPIKRKLGQNDADRSNFECLHVAAGAAGAQLGMYFLFT